MSLRDDLIRAGVPEYPPNADSLDVDRVERNITTAQPARIKVTVVNGRVVFRSVVGERRSVEVELARLWDSTRGRPLTAQELRERLGALRTSSDDFSVQDVARAREAGDSRGIGLDALAALLLVESVKGFGPGKFRELYEAGVSPAEVIQRPDLLPTRGKRGDGFLTALSALSDEKSQLAFNRAARQIVRAIEHDGGVLTFDHPLYPRNVLESNNPVPVLYVRGNSRVLADRRAVACVGSRQIRAPYSQLQGRFAETAAQDGFTIVSGFALGADTIAHEAASAAKGTTIAVMPGGLDRPFPPENRGLFDELLGYEGCVFVSEFPFGTAASSLTLRKRNKLIVAFALGVLIGQSSLRGGAMNAYRFALEQRKPVATFTPDGGPDTSGNYFIVEEAQRRRPEFESPLPPAFPAHPDPEEWTRWLRALSSST